MLKLLISVLFRVKIHISSHCRREITVFSHFPVPDGKEVRLCFMEKVVGDFEILRWIAVCDVASLLSCVFPGGTLGRDSSWNMGKALFSVPQSSWVMTLTIPAFSVHLCWKLGRCFTCATSRAHSKCIKWVKISSEGRE